jgi:hypothetical protein
MRDEEKSFITLATKVVGCARRMDRLREMEKDYLGKAVHKFEIS